MQIYRQQWWNQYFPEGQGTNYLTIFSWKLPETEEILAPVGAMTPLLPPPVEKYTGSRL